MRHMSYFFSSKEYRYFSVSSFYEKFGLICHEDNISAEIFQPSAFSMAGGIFFGGFLNGDD